MKILRSEQRHRIGCDIDYAIGLLNNIRAVMFGAYKTSLIRRDIEYAITSLGFARRGLPKTKCKIEYKHPRPLKPLIKIKRR